jgi:hypothetical protein
MVFSLQKSPRVGPLQCKDPTRGLKHASSTVYPSQPPSQREISQDRCLSMDA